MAIPKIARKQELFPDLQRSLHCGHEAVRLVRRTKCNKVLCKLPKITKTRGTRKQICPRD